MARVAHTGFGMDGERVSAKQQMRAARLHRLDLVGPHSEVIGATLLGGYPMLEMWPSPIYDLF